jgi:hypothetical protein
MMKLLTVALLLATLAAAGTAVAQEPEDGTPVARFIFEDQLVETDLIQPLMDQIFLRQMVAPSPLIKIRQDFVPELFKSTENL